MSKKTKLFASTAVLFLVFLLSPLFAIPVRAQSGTVCIEPASTTSCPAPTVLTGPVGTHLGVAANIQNSPGLNGFDIAVKTDPSILNPLSFNTTGYIFTGQNVLVVVDCINGVGMGCQAGVDGPGVARLAIVVFAFISPTPTTGRLFAITYNIVGGTSGTTIGYQTGCTGTSNDSFCVTIANGTPTPVPESLQTATFSNASTFSISANPTSLSFVQGGSGTSTITLTSIGGFSGTISLSTSLSPVVKRSPSVSLSVSMVMLSSGGTATSMLTVESNGGTAPGSYTVTLTAASGSQSGSLQISVTVLPRR